MLIINCSKPNGPERAIQNAVKHLPGVLVGNPIVSDDRGRNVETDAILILPTALAVVEAKAPLPDGPTSGELVGGLNSGITIGGEKAVFFGKTPALTQARQAAQKIAGFWRGHDALRHFVSAFLAVDGKDLVMTNGPLALGDTTLCLAADLDKGLAGLKSKQLSTVTLDEAMRFLELLELGENMPSREDVAAQGFATKRGTAPDTSSKADGDIGYGFGPNGEVCLNPAGWKGPYNGFRLAMFAIHPEELAARRAARAEKEATARRAQFRVVGEEDATVDDTVITPPPTLAAATQVFEPLTQSSASPAPDVAPAPRSRLARMRPFAFTAAFVGFVAWVGYALFGGPSAAEQYEQYVRAQFANGFADHTPASLDTRDLEGYDFDHSLRVRLDDYAKLQNLSYNSYCSEENDGVQDCISTATGRLNGETVKVAFEGDLDGDGEVSNFKFRSDSRERPADPLRPEEEDVVEEILASAQSNCTEILGADAVPIAPVKNVEYRPYRVIGFTDSRQRNLCVAGASAAPDYISTHLSQDDVENPRVRDYDFDEGPSYAVVGVPGGRCGETRTFEAKVIGELEPTVAFFELTATC